MRCLLITTLPLLASCNVDINLDLPPRKRWQQMARDFKVDYVLWMQGWSQYLTRLNYSARREWIGHHTIPEEYMEEIRGAVEAIDDHRVTEELVVLANSMYELKFPHFCSGVLAVDSEGTVYHGRNLDYWVPWATVMTPSGTRRLQVSANVTFWRGGKPVYQSVSMVGSPGIHTGMKLSGHRWSYEQNTHHGNDMRANLEAMKRGGLLFTTFVRSLMDEDVDFKTAVQRFEETNFAAPHYFVLAGQGPWEGASIEVHRMGADKLGDFSNIQVLSKQLGRWYLVQTNDRIWDKPEDDRRGTAYEMMHSLGGPAAMSHEKMMRIMSTPPLKNDNTLFSYVACPKTGRIEGWGQNLKDHHEEMAEPIMLAGGALRGKNWKIELHR